MGVGQLLSQRPARGGWSADDRAQRRNDIVSEGGIGFVQWIRETQQEDHPLSWCQVIQRSHLKENRMSEARALPGWPRSLRPDRPQRPARRDCRRARLCVPSPLVTWRMARARRTAALLSRRAEPADRGRSAPASTRGTAFRRCSSIVRMNNAFGSRITTSPTM